MKLVALLLLLFPIQLSRAQISTFSLNDTSFVVGQVYELNDDALDTEASSEQLDSLAIFLIRNDSLEVLIETQFPQDSNTVLNILRSKQRNAKLIAYLSRHGADPIRILKSVHQHFGESNQYSNIDISNLSNDGFVGTRLRIVKIYPAPRYQRIIQSKNHQKTFRADSTSFVTSYLDTVLYDSQTYHIIYEGNHRVFPHSNYFGMQLFEHRFLRLVNGAGELIYSFDITQDTDLLASENTFKLKPNYEITFDQPAVIYWQLTVNGVVFISEGIEDKTIILDEDSKD